MARRTRRPHFIQRRSKWWEEAHPLPPAWRRSRGTRQFLLFPVFVPDSLAIIWTTGPSCRSLASPRRLLGCSPLPLPLPSLSPFPFIPHLYLLDWKRPGIAWLLPWEKEQSSYQPEAQMYCTGLCSPAEPAKCFRRDTQTDLCRLILAAGDVQRLRWKKNNSSLALIKGISCFSTLRHVTTVIKNNFNSLSGSRCSL